MVRSWLCCHEVHLPDRGVVMGAAGAPRTADRSRSELLIPAVPQRRAGIVAALVLALASPALAQPCTNSTGEPVSLATAVRVLPACAGRGCRPTLLDVRLTAAGREWSLRLRSVADSDEF